MSGTAPLVSDFGVPAEHDIGDLGRGPEHGGDRVRARGQAVTANLVGEYPGAQQIAGDQDAPRTGPPGRGDRLGRGG